MGETRQDDMEALLQLKPRYARTGDMRQWDVHLDCLTEDYVGVFDGMPRTSPDHPTTGRFEGRKSIVEAMAKFLDGVVTVHQVYAPEITITGKDTAKGIWGIHDHLRFPTCIFDGWGHYHEDYVKQDGVWRIKNLVVTRLYVQEVWL